MVKGRSIGLAQAGPRYNTGNSDQSFALTVFGRSTRESNCDCDRSAEPSLLQTVFLQNDRTLLTMLEGSRGSWLDQVDRQLNAKEIQAENEDRVAALEKQIEQGEAKLEKLEKQKNEKAIRQAEQRLVQLENELADLKKETAKLAGQKPAEEQVSGLVIDAYLRTVSRYPTQDELTRSLQYVQESDEAVDGVRDVLWALLNTKEFIVNH
jgi:septal ring factor EnvC (AmiA/AmiB activator)